MPRKGGYGHSEPVEWVKLSQIAYGEAISSALTMRQDVQTWFTDAVAHHLYRCELLTVQECYRVDEAQAAAQGRPTPDKTNPRYAVNRDKPTITLPKGRAGENSGPGPAPAGAGAGR